MRGSTEDMGDKGKNKNNIYFLFQIVDVYSTIFFYNPLKSNPGSATGKCISSTISNTCCIKHFIITLLLLNILDSTKSIQFQLLKVNYISTHLSA